MKRGKKYLAAAQSYDRQSLYPIEEAIALVRKNTYCKFDASFEVNFSLNVDPRHADQQIRGAMVLPNGTGKSPKVLVVTQGAKEQEAKDAGADFVGGKDILEEIKGGWFGFDTIIATPDMMGELGKLGRLLGPKGLMPNPKAGTVTMDVEKAVKEAKAGKVEYRVDKQAIVHIGLGKISFGNEKLLENAQAFFESLKSQKPASLKGSYVKSVFLTTTMGPSIEIENLYN